MIYHLLDKPVRRMDDSRVEWLCLCGLRAALPPQPVPRLTAIKVPDKHGDEIVECAACYAGQDEKGEAPLPAGTAPNERELVPDLDADLGAEENEEAAPNEDDGAILSEESEEFPE